MFAPDIMEILARTAPGADDAPATDPGGAVAYCPLTTRRFDCGQVRGYLDAVLAVGERRKVPR